MAEKNLVIKLFTAMLVQLSCKLCVDGKGSITAQLGSHEPSSSWERASVDVLPPGVLPTA